MRLNNKGFAFSALLYGLLAVILVIMSLILGMYRKTNEETYYYSSVIEESLNKCVEAEIALENCYRSGVPACDTEAYYSCLGYDDLITTAKKVNFYSELEKKVVSGNTNGLHEVTGHSLKYVFQSNDTDNIANYVNFSGKNWRIIGLTPGGEIKIMLPDGIGSSEPWDRNGSTNWSNATLNVYLNNDFYDTLTNTNLIYKADWEAKEISSTDSGIRNLKKNAYFETLNSDKYSAKVGLLTPADYAYSVLSGCGDTAVVYNNPACVKSWLKKYPTWLLPGSLSTEKKGYVLPGNGTVQITAINNTESHITIPVVYLASDTQIFENVGDGTSGSPYVIAG